MKKITDTVYEITPFEDEDAAHVPMNTFIEPGERWLMHMCNPPLHKFAQIVLRENEAGPLYWCTGCGYTVEEGVSMAIRLNEVDI